MNPISLIPVLLLAACTLAGCRNEARLVQKPIPVVSMRQVIYDRGTYAQLDSLWQTYYAAFPSDAAYGNWMYAARYAGNPMYLTLLDDGLSRYPGNACLLYLKALTHHGKPRNLEGLALLERAVELDPSYADPWFAVAIHYMESGEQEKLDVALRKILESGVVTDEIMDFSYNMLTGLDTMAVLVTNGDNDTYPGWILTRLLGYRSDVLIVNRNLLNTEWYPGVLESAGIPRFISEAGFDSVRTAFENEVREGKGTGIPTIGDRLMERLVSACLAAERPVSFAVTAKQSTNVCGLVVPVPDDREPDAEQTRRAVAIWLEKFRTGGLDSWNLRTEPPSHAGKMLMNNYADALTVQLPRIARHAPESRAPLFRWYTEHLMPVLTADRRARADSAWCRNTDVAEIRNWCRTKNLAR